jgi:hypothetical protein
MRKALFVTCLLTISSGAVAEPIGWHKYVVTETGASVDMPTIFSRDMGPTKEGHGRLFMTSDGRATLAVQSVQNLDHPSPAAYLAEKHPPSNIFYKRITDNFFVVSSFRNNLIWYDRCNFLGGFINCVIINYPTAEKRQWDGVVTRISHSLASK